MILNPEIRSKARRGRRRLLFLRQPRRDFRPLLQEMLDAGYRRAELARMLNVPFNTLKGWIDGARLYHDDGEAVIDLHKDLCQLRNSATENTQG